MRRNSTPSAKHTPTKHVLCIPGGDGFRHGRTRHHFHVPAPAAGSGGIAAEAPHGTCSTSAWAAASWRWPERCFGARQVLGLDNDPHAVRTAKENARLNGLAGRHVRFEQAELPVWHRPPEQTWPVVTANLFSELLIRLLPEDHRSRRGVRGRPDPLGRAGNASRRSRCGRPAGGPYTAHHQNPWSLACIPLLQSSRIASVTQGRPAE